MKEKLSAQLDSDLSERLRNAVAAVPSLSITKVVDEALRKELKALERKHNGGQPFPDRGGYMARPITSTATATA